MSRGIAIVVALVLAAGAAYVWLGPGAEEQSHGQIEGQDREALERLLREEDRR